MQGRILIVEDERDLAQALEYQFQHEGYTCWVAGTGQEAVRRLELDPKPDLVILDLMLPDIPGTEICRQIKGNDDTRGIPVVFLSARGDEIDRVVGFELGAEDYVVKPFSLRELVLRVRAILRYTRPQAGGGAPTDAKTRQSHGVLEVDPAGFRAWVDGEEVALSALELKLLLALMARPGWVHSREQLLDEVWGEPNSVSVRAVDSHVKRLRRKLGPAANYLEAIRGVGYRFRADTAAAATS